MADELSGEQVKEIGLYDLPAIVDYVGKETGLKVRSLALRSRPSRTDLRCSRSPPTSDTLKAAAPVGRISLTPFRAS